MDQGRTSTATSLEAFPMDIDVRDVIAGGLLYSEMGVNLQVFTNNFSSSIC